MILGTKPKSAFMAFLGFTASTDGAGVAAFLALPFMALIAGGPLAAFSSAAQAASISDGRDAFIAFLAFGMVIEREVALENRFLRV